MAYPKPSVNNTQGAKGGRLIDFSLIFCPVLKRCGFFPVVDGFAKNASGAGIGPA